VKTDGLVRSDGNQKASGLAKKRVDGDLLGSTFILGQSALSDSRSGVAYYDVPFNRDSNSFSTIIEKTDAYPLTIYAVSVEYETRERRNEP